MKSMMLVALVSSMTLSAFAEVDVEADPDEFILPGSGSIAVVSFAKESEEVARKAAADFEEKTLVKTAFAIATNEFCCTKGCSLLCEYKANAAVYVVDVPGLPIGMVAMEDRWAFVNVAALRRDNPDAQKLDKRIRCMITRSAGQLLGVLVPHTTTGIMVGAASLSDLDVIKTEYITFDLLANVKRFSDKSGLTPGRRMGYRKACERGLAPAPVTDYQKKVWNEFHSMPTKPIKIKFDKQIGK